MKKYLKPILIALIAIPLLILVILTIIYLSSIKNPSLRNTPQTQFTYEQAVKTVEAARAEEKSLGVSDDGLSVLLTHGKKTDRAVIMMHGYSMYPAQFSELGKQFYDKGYNVYIPRFPQHGLGGREHLTKLRATALVKTANEAVNLTAGLGNEIGVIGLSGGGNLATWATINRNDVIKRAVLISPFYMPSAKNMPGWQEPVMVALYGNRILPDTYDGQLSFTGLAQYLMVYRSLPKNPHVTLESLGMVFASHDFDIHKAHATDVFERLVSGQVKHKQLISTPEEWRLGHDIVNPKGSDLGDKKIEMYRVYFDLYEGRDVASER